MAHNPKYTSKAAQMANSVVNAIIIAAIVLMLVCGFLAYLSASHSQTQPQVPNTPTQLVPTPTEPQIIIK